MASAWNAPRTQGFGPTSEALDGPYQGYAHFNKGVDFGAAAGSTVEARVGGTVIAVGNQGDGWGFSVKVKDAQGNTHNYGHLSSSIPVKVGQQIQPGELVGTVGEKIEGEASTGPHLSYDVWDSSGQFFDALAQDSSGGGTVTQPSSGGGRYYPDPETDAEYVYYRDAVKAAQRAYVAAGHPSSGPLYEAMQNAMLDMEDFTTWAGHPKSTANDVDPAQQEFENRIQLGDYEGRQADRAFSQWFDKYQSAQTNASQDFAQRSQHNADLAANAEARNTSQTPSQLPRNTDRGYIEQSRSELMDMYLKKAGIGEQAPAGAGSGIQTPGQMQSSTPSQGPTYNGSRSMSGDLASAFPPQAAPASYKPPVSPGSTNPFGNQKTPASAASSFWGEGGAPFPEESKGNSFQLFDKNRPLDIANKVAGVATAGPRAGKKVAKWWKRAFAEGGTNIPGGPGWVGERGPEMMEIPGFGAKIVGQNGPEQVQIPEGANIIPMDEQFAFHQIQQAAKMGNQPDIAQQQMSAQERMNDPQLREKVIESLKKGMAANMVQNPPYTPILENPALQRDRWAANRQLTGVPASQEEAAMMQEQAAKGAKRG